MMIVRNSLGELAQGSGTGAARPRILIYVQDSWGFGHISRVSKLSRVLRTVADCLILCGHREASWIIPDGVEYVRLPSFNTPLSLGSGGVFWGPPSFKLRAEQAAAFRVNIIEEVVRGFAPNIVIVENRPLGMSDELAPILERTTASKVFLTRGIMTHPDRVDQSYLSHRQRQALQDQFDKIIVACDSSVWNMASQYRLDREIGRKLEYVGYMSEFVDPVDIARARHERGLSEDSIWVVCSAGGGALGERLIEEVLSIAPSLTTAQIDIVQGPHSKLNWPSLLGQSIDLGWAKLHHECKVLPLLHAAADLTICSSGYNSLLESMEGGGQIITTPVQEDKDDEQSLLSSLLARYYPIRVASAYSDIGRLAKEVLDQVNVRASIRSTGRLNFNGLANAKDVLMALIHK